MSAAERPDLYKKALGYSMGIMYVLYMVPALCAVLLWGWHFDFLLNTDFGQGPLSIVVQLFIFFPNLLDFLLSCLILNDAFARRFIYKKAEEPELNPTVWRQLTITLPTLVFAFIFATFVPSFETLVGISNSLTIIPGITWMISVAWFVGLYRPGPENSGIGAAPKTMKIMQLTTFAVGLFFSLVFFVSFIQDFVTEDWSLSGVFCG